MHFRGGNCGVHGLSEGVLEEARICLFKYAYVVRVELNIDDVLMLGACNGDYGGSLISIGVSMVLSMMYAWGFANEMTKLVNCDELGCPGG